MSENLLPFKKSERYGLYRGRTELNGEFVESDQLGFAFLKPGKTLFRLRLWLFPKEQYFLAIDDNDPVKYVVLSLDEYEVAGESRKNWHRIGEGQLQGNFIRLKFWLLSEEIYLCLFPAKVGAEVSRAA